MGIGSLDLAQFPAGTTDAAHPPDDANSPLRNEVPEQLGVDSGQAGIRCRGESHAHDSGVIQ